MPFKIPDKITCSTAAPPVHWQLAYEPLLYHQEDYLKAQAELPSHSFWLLEEPKQLIWGQTHLHVSGDAAVSQLFAPFGSLIAGNVGVSVLKGLLNSIERSLRDQGVKHLTWRHYPEFYGRQENWLKVLRDKGYQSIEMINHHIPIDSMPFHKKIHGMQVRKLDKCQGLAFQCHPFSKLREIYQFIAGCRQQRAQQLSLNYRSLSSVMLALPHNFLLCTVRDDEVIAAATVVIKVSSGQWYNFYPAHHRKYSSMSPMVFLLAHLYELAGKYGVSAIDLGTSQLQGQPLEGLMEFKSRVGGVESIKPSFYKEL